MKYSKIQYTFFKILSLSLFPLFFSYGQESSKKIIDKQLAPLNSCSIPDRTDIVHFPIQKQNTISETLKIFQETLLFLKEKWDNIAQYNHDENTQTSISDVVEKTAYSQFKLAKLIQNNPNSFVFHEFVTEIYDSRDIDYSSIQNNDSVQNPDQLSDQENPEPEHLFQLVNHQFPKGLPEKYNSLTRDQRYTLYIVGGTHTLFFLGELPVIYPSISEEDEDYKKIKEAYCYNDYNIFNICHSPNGLEKKLAVAVNSFLNAFPSKNKVVVLVYSDNPNPNEQNIQDYFKDKNFYRIPESCLSIETE